MGIVIRPWQKGDLEALRKITWQSWISAYSGFIPESDLKSYFDIHYTDTAFLNMFDNPFMQGFIAEWDDQIAGYIRLFFNQEENRLYVPSFYLLQEFQGQDIGSYLLRAAETYAAEKHLNELWLGVMVENRPALLFYRKAGFLFVREEPFTMGNTTVSHLIGYKKLGKNAFLNQKTYASFDGGQNLSELCLELLSEQKKSWPDLREGYELLKNVRERDLSFMGFSVRLQYNPGRIKSSTADMTEKNVNPVRKSSTFQREGSHGALNPMFALKGIISSSPLQAGLSNGVKERRCFLCLDHLPEGQRGILYRSEYLILSNPMPVFSPHFTVSHLDHRHQAISEHIDTLLRLTADFGSGWMVLYNGPRCGASAPDHLHFQTAPSGKMPIEKEMREEKRLALIKKVGGVLLYRVRDLGREVIILEGDDPMAVEAAFKSFLNGLKKALLINEEPMINIAGFYKERKWHLLVFPRRKHRPDAFSKEGDARIVVSPGVIDMGGVMITPVEKDFERLDKALVEGIYGEVSLEGKTVETAIKAMI